MSLKPLSRIRCRVIFCGHVLLYAIACANEPQTLTLRRPDMESLLVRAELGVRMRGDRLSVLRRPMDAIFLGDEVLVLDESPPWVRVFDHYGDFRRAMIRQGDGPGEVVRPYTLAATEDGGFVVAHSRGIDRFDRDGASVHTFRSQGRYWARGAIETCNGSVFSLSQDPGRIDDPGQMIKVAVNMKDVDTLALLSPLRPRSQLRKRASYIERTTSGLLLYPEELRDHRLIEVGCNGSVLREFHLDPLGEPERVSPGPADRPGTFSVTAPAPPIPGGIGLVDGRVLWATLTTVPALRATADSITVITAFEEDGEVLGRVTIEGWLQLLDSDGAGWLLLGDADGLHPRVLLVDGVTLLQMVN